MINKVVAVIVTYNRLQKLKKCIDCLKQSQTPVDVYVVDNASTDGTSDWLKTQLETGILRYAKLFENIGGAGGFNAGMRWAAEAGYAYIWLMDDDCMVHDDSLSELMAADKVLHGEYGWLSSVALWTDGTPCYMNRQKIHDEVYLGFDKLKYGIVRSTQATFVSLLVKSSVVKQVGLPISDFFIWGDDIEYTRRISVRSNIPSYVVGRSVVTHEMKENTGSNIAIDSAERLSRYRYAYRNEGYLFRMEGLRGVAYFVAKCMYNFMRICIKARNNRLKRLWILVSSSVKGLVFNPRVEKV